MMEENIKQSRNEQIEKHLKDKYRFRFNILKSRTEWMQEVGQPYRPITKFHINSIRRELDNSKGIVTSADNLRMILESDFAERVNPVQEYFNTLNWKSVDVSTMPCAILEYLTLPAQKVGKFINSVNLSVFYLLHSIFEA
ncbi:MAG: hypothetical protein SNH27_17925, partial [Rikenellaceae bacterium]